MLKHPKRGVTKTMGKSDRTILCIGIGVLDVVARPIGAPDSWKEKQRIESVMLLPGGDAANQSIHLAALGYHVMLNCCVGADTNGQTVRAALTARGVDTSLVRTKEGVGTATALLLVSSDGERHIFSIQGAHSTLCRDDLPETLPPGCAAVSLGSLYGMPLAEQDGLAPLLRQAKEKGIPVFADLDSARVTSDLSRFKELLPLIDYLLPSWYDILPMTESETVEEAVCKLMSYGVGHIIVKRGEAGAVICEEGKRPITIPAIPVTPVDTTGAGDCMSATFLSRIIEGDTIPEACAYACAAGSYSTLFPGANTVQISDEKIREFLKKSS